MLRKGCNQQFLIALCPKNVDAFFQFVLIFANIFLVPIDGANDDF
jgi:hypothetical protein